MTGYRLSNTTKVVSLRLPNEVIDIIHRRADKQGKLVSDYLRARVCYDVQRNHKRKEVRKNGECN